MKRKFKDYPVGYFHIDIAEVRTEEGVQQLFVAIDRASKLAYAELHEKKTRAAAAAFLRSLIARVPYRIHTILTDNGLQFADRRRNGGTPVNEFDRVCRENGTEHRLTKRCHPWTNGQVERMNRTLKEATVKRYHYGSHQELREHLERFLDVYNFAKRLKALKGRTPYEEVMRWWQNEPERFIVEPDPFTIGINT